MYVLMRSLGRSSLCALATASLCLAPLAEAKAQSDLSRASELSLLPVAMSVAAPVALVVAGATLTVVGVEASASGTVWIVERASDGARQALRFSGQVAGAASQAVGSAITVMAVGTGLVLSCAGKAIAFIPNEIGAALLYNERVTR
ncbi:MAG: hypothetical protein ACXWGT_03205 [Usitatibacter sp.]